MKKITLLLSMTLSGYMVSETVKGYEIFSGSVKGDVKHVYLYLMIKRYWRKELTDGWAEENKYKIWLEVEIAAA